ncbi:hypothetical protein ACFL42_03705 [Candidatus Omnitrophota bacterium]
MSPQDIMTAEEIAILLYIKVGTLYDNRWRALSKCPLFRQGRRLFGYRKEIEAWYRNRMQYV